MFPYLFKKCGSFIDDSYQYQLINDLEEIFEEMMEKYPQMIFMDIRSLQCKEGICETVVNNYPVYNDDTGHITNYASYYYGNKYLELYGNPLK
jgi:hypothetical protein